MNGGGSGGIEIKLMVWMIERKRQPPARLDKKANLFFISRFDKGKHKIVAGRAGCVQWGDSRCPSDVHFRKSFETRQKVQERNEEKVQEEESGGENHQKSIQCMRKVCLGV